MSGPAYAVRIASCCGGRFHGWPPSNNDGVEYGRLKWSALMRSRVGEPAVDFCLPDSDGVVHKLCDYAGRWLLLVFHRHLG